MKDASSQSTRPTKLLALVVFFSLCGFVTTIHAAEPVFDGGKSTWHDGFVRYDFVMDDQTLAVTPFTRPEKEGFEVGAPAKGQRFRMVGTVVKPGRTITVVEGQAFAIDGEREKLVATMQTTLMAVVGRDDVKH